MDHHTPHAPAHPEWHCRRFCVHYSCGSGTAGAVAFGSSFLFHLLSTSLFNPLSSPVQFGCCSIHAFTRSSLLCMQEW